MAAKTATVKTRETRIIPTQSSEVDLATPGDDAVPKPKRKHPSKGRSYRILGEGEGDYCIFEMADKDSQMPGGTLIPIPEVPRFEDTASAMRWVKTDSGDLLMGKQVMIFKAMEIMRINVLQKPQVNIEKKPRILIKTPEVEDGET